MTHSDYPTPLIQTRQLAALLGDPRVKLLDGTWYLPPTTLNARAEYEQEHLPGAMYFDIDAVVDSTSSLPHTLPSPEEFSEAVGAMGIGNDDYVVVYDRQGLFSAARVWWMFHVFGHTHVAVLDGGLPRWKAEGHPVSGEPVTPETQTFTPCFQPEWVRQTPDVLKTLEEPTAQILDMRPLGRYLGQDPEPRPGLRAGHIPGSASMPWNTFLNPEDKTILSREQLLTLLAERQLNPEQPMTCYCGSGVGACVATLAMTAAGINGLSVYDGSWAEWGADENLPIER